ncbi:UDP-galactose phosphate transferase [Ornithinimicrobium sp. CNJ-824]|uniref:sugar transferase n=1 Tax=Ornithinimicrobium sp. CNJ-824 TaxID=1904966 RepID=UPI000961D31B|nr:sugar transferase [Ornithinimicrobium sp. CNJ-824]OLT21789.1 UDP-galactose phosphate transferase [Ornithinimicrobium sp. CNJ-824]
MSYRGKRAFDIAIAVPALILTAPLQLLTGLSIRLAMGRPVLFRQERAGLDGKPFTLIKFRTMKQPQGAVDQLTDAERVTSVGSVLRVTSLDELPTLWNVLKGDMSIVGPRPLLLQYASRYTPYEARRLEAKPGITGLAQVSGRNGLSWSERFEMDVQYVDDASLSWDVKILSMTLWQVLRHEGVSPSDGLTMPEFIGSMPEGKDHFPI